MNREEKINAMAEKAKELAKTRKAIDHSASKYVGAIGDRIEITGEVLTVKTFKKEIEGQEHDAFITIIKTHSGDIVKYWNKIRQKKTQIELEAGATVKFRATVVQHSEYKGEQQTTIQRAHVLDIIE